MLFVYIDLMILQYYCFINFPFNPHGNGHWFQRQWVFQHRSYVVTALSYRYVKEYKKQMLFHITKLLNDLDIRFVIADGNLLEFERDTPIYHDDDLDIRMNIDDFEKWKAFCWKSHYYATEYNLHFDHRLRDLDKQLQNGLQVSLIQFYNPTGMIEFDRWFLSMDMHMDVNFSVIRSVNWIDYDIDWNDLRKIEYLGVKTYAPNEEDTDMLLKKMYGRKYMIPDYDSYEIY